MQTMWNVQAARLAPAQKSNEMVHVASCIVKDDMGRVLMARRPMHQLSGGFWEIPGGKVELGENTVTAATRELFEETGIKANTLRPVCQFIHQFPTRAVHLTIYEAVSWTGTPEGREGQAVDWVDTARPHVMPLLESNYKILRLMNLPRTVMQVQSPKVYPARWADDVVASAEAVGAGAVWFSTSGLPPMQKATLARRLTQNLAKTSVQLWSAGSSAQTGAELEIHTAVSLPAVRTSGALYGVVEADIAKLSVHNAYGADVCFVPVPASASAEYWTIFTNLTQTLSASIYPMIEAADTNSARMAQQSGAFAT